MARRGGIVVIARQILDELLAAAANCREVKVGCCFWYDASGQTHKRIFGCIEAAEDFGLTHWTAEGLEAVPALRSISLNRDWEAFWKTDPQRAAA